VLDPNGIALTTVVGDQLLPDIASEPSGRYLAVWIDRHAGTAKFDVFGAVLDVTGQVIAKDILIATADGDQVTPAVAFDPTSGVFLVVWVDRRSGLSDLDASRVTPDGVVLDPPAGVALVTSGVLGTIRRSRSAAIGSSWRGARLNLLGARQTVGGSDRSMPITIRPRRAQCFRASCFSRTRQALRRGLVRRPARDVGLQRHLRHARQRGTGALAAAEHLISANPEDETRPAFSRGKVKKSGTSIEVLIGYQRLVSTAETERAMLRKVTYEP
jgi:hypothetical protein